MKTLKQYLSVSDEVRAALDAKQPVVALESTIISHGMPYPQNVSTALMVEKAVRAAGAVPATIAIIGGVLKAGLSADEIEYIGKKGLAVTKASRRDLPLLLASGGDGAATVAATMLIARLSGVSVFATGGIGGVHRGAQTTMDISADLEELAKTPVLVVCAGPKSILDIGLTLEYLETRGVPVLGYRTDELPAFYTRSSGYAVDARMDSPRQIAAAFAAQRAIGLSTGMIVADPIPESHSMDAALIASVIERQLELCRAEGVTGKTLTPRLLDGIRLATEGKSLEANIALVLNNADLAARIAAELCALAACD